VGTTFSISEVRRLCVSVHHHLGMSFASVSRGSLDGVVWEEDCREPWFVCWHMWGSSTGVSSSN